MVNIFVDIEKNRIHGIFSFMVRRRVYIFIVLLALLSVPAHGLTPDEEVNIRVYSEYSSAVVNISTTIVAYDFFYNPVPERGTGSGAIIDERGYIVTNYHVVANARHLEVTLHDGTKYSAKLVGVAPQDDIALLKIETGGKPLKTIPFGDSSTLKVGQKVLVIGNPFGLERTLTVGIISSLGRKLRTEDGRLIRGVIQTDAAINPGNSGGPLLDTEGRMIGVSTAIFSPVGANIGIGFAIPVNRVKRVVEELMKKGYVARPWLGIKGQDVDEKIASLLGLPQAGVLVAEVIPNSPAYRAGLKGGTYYKRAGNLLFIAGGDLIVAINGKPVRRMDDLDEIMDELKVGQKITVTIIRKGRKIEKRLTLEEMPQTF